MSGGGGGGGGDPNADKSSLTILWAVGALFAIGVVIWHFFGLYFKIFFLKVRLFESHLIGFFSNDGDVIAEQIRATDPFLLDLHWAGVLGNLVGGYLQYPVIGLLIAMIVTVYFSHANLRFSKTYDMTKLAEQEKQNWPQISPVVNLDLIKEDIHKGPWAMAMPPMTFAKQYKLITVEMIPDKKSPWKAEGVYKATVDKEKAAHVFINQLGHPWQGIDKLPMHIQALFAVFAARVEHDSNSATAMIFHLAASAAKGKPDYTGVPKLLKKYIQSKAVQRCVQRHAYVYTVMASMLALARTDGVLATADFLWLKPIDRRLWYILSSVGRQVAFPEVAGIFAHWLAEKEMGRPLFSPMVEEAVKGLELAMERTIYTPAENEEIPLLGSEQHG